MLLLWSITWMVGLIHGQGLAMYRDQLLSVDRSEIVYSHVGLPALDAGCRVRDPLETSVFRATLIQVNEQEPDTSCPPVLASFMLT